MKNHLLILLLLIIVTACSKAGKSSAKIAVTIAGLSAPVGGMIVTGKQVDGGSFSKVMSEDSVSLLLENGDWNFLVVSWDGGTPFEGKIRCDYKKAVTLNGKEVDLNFELSNLKCSSGDLAVSNSWDSGASPPDFKSTSLHLCRTADALTSNPGACVFNSVILDSYAASVGSIKVSVPNSIQTDKGVIIEGSAGLVHSCLTTTNPITGLPRIPNFVADFYFPMRFQSYLKAGCTGKSIDAYVATDTAAAFAESTENRFYAHYSDQQICAIANSGVAVTALDDIGLGNDRPYGLCNLAQLKDWQQNYATKTLYQVSNVYLLADLNLNEWVFFKNLTVTPNAYSDCISDGSTFIPIGSTESSCILGQAASFSGVFHGLAHTLKHVRFKMEDSAIDRVGLFRSVSGKVVHLTLEKPDFEGDEEVGSIAGELAASGEIHHIKINDGKIDANMDWAGGVVGKVGSGAILNDLFVTNTTVRGKNKLGGIVGETSSTVQDASFKGSVISEGSAGAMYFGGIAGLGSTINRAVSSGLVSGPTKVGGIAGSLTGSASYVRSIASVRSTETMGSIHLGGLLGFGGGFIANSFFAGSLQHFCSSGPSCYIGELAGDLASTKTKTWSPDYSFASLYGGVTGESTGDVQLAHGLTEVPICPAGNCTVPATQWTAVIGGLPRLNFEDEPCELAQNLVTLETQSLSGRGITASNPLKICKYSQLAELSGVNKFVELADNVFVGDAIQFEDMIFPGQLDGKGHALFGGRNPGGNFSIFESLEATAVVKNLRLIDFVGGTPVDSNTATLTNINHGLISNIDLSFAHLEGTIAAGLVVTNETSGKIEDVTVKASIKGEATMGGIVATNEGSLQRVIFEGDVGFYNSFGGSSTAPAGGIVADNSGSISQALFKGTLAVQGDNSAAITGGAGGIAGKSSGTISDVLLDRSAKVSYSDDMSNVVGGLVGTMLSGSQLTRAVALGSVGTNGDSTSTTVSGRVGSNAGTISHSYFDVPVLDNYVFASGFAGTTTCSASSGLSNGTYYLTHSSFEGLFVSATVLALAISYTNPNPPSCNSSANVYASSETPDPLPTPLTNAAGFLALRSAAGGSYSIRNSNVNAEATLILASYKNFLDGTSTAIPATWTWEDDEFSLFFFKD